MANENSHIDIHTEEIQDILGQVPNRIMKYGMFAISAIFALFVFLLYIIKYPDIIPGQLVIYANNPPKAVVAHSPGKILTLLVNENMSVNNGDILAIIESTSRYDQVIELENELDSVEVRLKNDAWEKLVLSSSRYTQLGELQASFQNLSNNLFQIKSLLNQNIYHMKRSILASNITNVEQLKNSLLSQKESLQKDYQLTLDDYKAQKKLFEAKVISASELRQGESKVLAKKNALENIDASILNNSTNTLSYKKESIDLEKQLLDAKNNFKDGLSKVRNEISSWKRKYLLISPVKGLVSFNQKIQELQDVPAEQPIFYITPENNGNFGEMNISQNNFGKIEVGQSVLIHLDSYPFQEYGSIKGDIEAISNIPSPNGNYLIKVKLPTQLITNIGLGIPFKNGLTGNGQIITKRVRIIDKFYYSLNSLFDKKVVVKSNIR